MIGEYLRLAFATVVVLPPAPPTPPPLAPPTPPVAPPAPDVVHDVVAIGYCDVTQDITVATSAAGTIGADPGGIGKAVLVMREIARCAKVAFGSAKDFAVRFA